MHGMTSYMLLNFRSPTRVPTHRHCCVHNMLYAFQRSPTTHAQLAAIAACTGVRNMARGSCKDLPSNLELFVDGQPVHIPSDTESVIVLNINSYAGGSRLWTSEGPRDSASPNSGSPSKEDRGAGWFGTSPRSASAAPQRLLFADDSPLSDGNESDGAKADDDRTDDEGSVSDASSRDSAEARRMAAFGASRMDDGMLEVVGVTGLLHLGAIQVSGFAFFVQRNMVLVPS